MERARGWGVRRPPLHYWGPFSPMFSKKMLNLKRERPPTSFFGKTPLVTSTEMAQPAPIIYCMHTQFGYAQLDNNGWLTNTQDLKEASTFKDFLHNGNADQMYIKCMDGFGETSIYQLVRIKRWECGLGGLVQSTGLGIIHMTV